MARFAFRRMQFQGLLARAVMQPIGLSFLGAAGFDVFLLEANIASLGDLLADQPGAAIVFFLGSWFALAPIMFCCAWAALGEDGVYE